MPVGIFQPPNSGTWITAVSRLRKFSLLSKPASVSTFISISTTKERSKVIRPSVRFPEGITAEIARVGQSQLLLARCCDQFDEDLLIESMNLDALMPKEEAVVRRLMREMIDFQRDLIFPAN